MFGNVAWKATTRTCAWDAKHLVYALVAVVSFAQATKRFVPANKRKGEKEREREKERGRVQHMRNELMQKPTMKSKVVHNVHKHRERERKRDAHTHPPVSQANVIESIHFNGLKCQQAFGDIGMVRSGKKKKEEEEEEEEEKTEKEKGFARS